MPESLKKLHEVTEAVLYLPGVDRRSVQSLWTPNTRVYELTEEGFQAEDVIGGTVTPEALDADKITVIRDRAARGGYTGWQVPVRSDSACLSAGVSACHRSPRLLRRSR